MRKVHKDSKTKIAVHNVKVMFEFINILTCLFLHFQQKKMDHKKSLEIRCRFFV